MITIQWGDLLRTVQDDLDDASGYNTTISEAEWIGNLNELLQPFNAVFDANADAITFYSEPGYTMFLLRWS